MHPVVERDQLSPNVVRLVVEAPRIAKVRRPGQFVIVRKGPGAERIPLTIADNDAEAGTITLMIQAIGDSTTDLAALQVGDAIQRRRRPAGPRDGPHRAGHAVCVGGGVGTAVILPDRPRPRRTRRPRDAASSAAARGSGSSSRRSCRACGDVVVCTDDGSYGRHGFVTQALKDILDAGGVDAVYAVGPVPMMRAVSEMTRPYGVETTVSLNAIMVDGTGMCGGCRVTVGGETKYACVDGPEFDAHAGQLPGAGRPADDLPLLRAGRARAADGRARRRAPARPPR